MDSVDVKALSELYESIDDVDLFILGLAEKPEPGSLVGPTFACIIGRQFQNVRILRHLIYKLHQGTVAVLPLIAIKMKK